MSDWELTNPEDAWISNPNSDWELTDQSKKQFNLEREFSLNRRNPSETKGMHGIGNDIQNSFEQSKDWVKKQWNNPEEAVEGLGKLIEEGGEAAKQLNFEPGRFGKNATVGLGNAARGLASVPGNFADYLARKDIISEDVAKEVIR